jgi:hypothetical protein
MAIRKLALRKKRTRSLPVNTVADLLNACKQGLRISESNTAYDELIRQKIAVVEGFLRKAGVSEEVLASDQAVGTIVIGVVDIFGVSPGEMKFSQVFHTLATQLAIPSAAAAESGE